jgi:hypothetical protein
METSELAKPGRGVTPECSPCGKAVFNQYFQHVGKSQRGLRRFPGHSENNFAASPLMKQCDNFWGIVFFLNF